MNRQDEMQVVSSRRSFLFRAGGAFVASVALRRATLASDFLSVPESAPDPPMPSFIEHYVSRDGHKLYAREYAGSGPALVLLHGFPDNLHIYDRLIPFLANANRHVVAFDFLGFGASDKPADYKYTFEQQTGDIQTVVDFLKLEKVVPVAHDAGGVAAIDYVLANPQRIGNMCLLNTFYGDAPTLRFPELIALFADPDLKAFSQAILSDPKQVEFLLTFQERQFQTGVPPELKDVMNKYLQPIINNNFAQHPSAGPAFAQLTGGLNPQLKLNDKHLSQFGELTLPISIIWGQGDPYLNTGVAKDFAERLKKSSLHLVDAGHWPQIDRPELVAKLLLEDIL
jgi:pimeloyl-ACP methyl ester carboxylesterase